MVSAGQHGTGSLEPTGADLAAAARAGSLGEVALAYAKLGIPVLPLHHPVGSDCSCGADTCRNSGKHPRIARGSRGASTKSVWVRDWWWRWPASNIGLATGHVVDVIDADGPAGLQAISDLAAAGRLPEVLAWASTGRGAHAYVRATGGGNAIGVVPGLDYRGEGGLVVAPPSVHRSGANYMWGPVALPDGDAERGEAMPAMPWESATQIATAAAPRPAADRAEKFAAGRLRAALGRISSAGEGDRHGRVYSESVNVGAVVGAGWLSARHAETELVAAAVATGLDDADARRTVERGLDEGVRLPAPELPHTSAEREVEAVVAAILADVDARLDEFVSSQARRLTHESLTWLARRALQRNALTVPASVRDLEDNLGATHGVAERLRPRLLGLPWLEVAFPGSRGSCMATVVRLVVPETAKVVQVVGYPEGATHPVPPLQFDVTERSAELDLVTGRRSLGGLTRNDLALLRALPKSGPIRTVAWYEAADVSERTAYNALDPSRSGSLAALGLVTKPKRGWVAATARAADLAALAAEIGVEGRQARRVEAIGDERAVDAARLAGRSLARAVGGQAAAGERDRVVVHRALPDAVSAEVDGLLATLDALEDPRPVRAAARAVVGAADVPEAAREALVSASRLLGPVAVAAAAARYAVAVADGRRTGALVMDPVTGELPDDPDVRARNEEFALAALLSGVVGDAIAIVESLAGTVATTVTDPATGKAQVVPVTAMSPSDLMPVARIMAAVPRGWNNTPPPGYRAIARPVVAAVPDAQAA